MKYLILPILCLFVSCASVDSVKKFDEPKARDAAEWVRNRSGFIEAAVATITHVAVYAAEKDSVQRANTLELLNIISSKLNKIAQGGNFESGEIGESLEIKEPELQVIITSILNLASFEFKNFKKNGYAEFSGEVLKAICQGIQDGTAL